jgi:hypothetical protein
VVFPDPDLPNSSKASPPESEKSGKEMGDCPGWAKRSDEVCSDMNLFLATSEFRKTNSNDQVKVNFLELK